MSKENKPKTMNDIREMYGLPRIEDKPNYYVKGLEGSLKEYQEEVKRLNNIINELEEWTNNIMFTQGTYCIDCMQVLNKIKELKGSESNE